MTLEEYAKEIADGIQSGWHDAYSIEVGIRNAAKHGIEVMLAGYVEDKDEGKVTR